MQFEGRTLGISETETAAPAEDHVLPLRRATRVRILKAGTGDYAIAWKRPFKSPNIPPGASKNTPNIIGCFQRPEGVESIRITPLYYPSGRRVDSILEASVARAHMCLLAHEPSGRMVYSLFHRGSLWVHRRCGSARDRPAMRHRGPTVFGAAPHGCIGDTRRYGARARWAPVARPALLARLFAGCGPVPHPAVAL